LEGHSFAGTAKLISWRAEPGYRRQKDRGNPFWGWGRGHAVGLYALLIDAGIPHIDLST